MGEGEREGERELGRERGRERERERERDRQRQRHRQESPHTQTHHLHVHTCRKKLQLMSQPQSPGPDGLPPLIWGIMISLLIKGTQIMSHN